MAEEMELSLRTRMLPYWLSVKDPVGGFWTSVDARGGVIENAPKTLVFAARVAWTFVTAARHYDEPALAAGAQWALDHFDRFRDDRSGGYFASLDRDAQPLDRSKHVYGQAFALFCLAAAAMSGDAGRKAAALDLFDTIETRARFGVAGLYVESFDEEWNETINADRALGEAPARHTADTHLHLIEAYLELLRATGAPRVARALLDLVDMFLDRFLSPDGTFAHQKATADGAHVGKTIWPGHDIEASWLLTDAADHAADQASAARIRNAALALARGAATYGRLESGAWRERVAADNAARPDIIWWAQAEALLGQISLGLIWRDAAMLDQAHRTWAFVRRFFLDPATGDWRLRVLPSGQHDPVAPRILYWKDPYHQARACMEIPARIRAALRERLFSAGA